MAKSPDDEYMETLEAEIERLRKERDELLKFLKEIESVKPTTKDLWIHTVKCKAAGLIVSMKGAE